MASRNLHTPAERRRSRTLAHAIAAVALIAAACRPPADSVRIAWDPPTPDPKDYRILVATEVLAEGVNLHRSNIVINYDIPWNPTRLIQRVTRSICDFGVRLAQAYRASRALRW